MWRVEFMLLLCWQNFHIFVLCHRQLT